MLMEQTPSVTNWQPYNALKRPGVMRLQSLQAVAHGADSVMFFQVRRSIGACEKFHGAIIDHAGHENTRVFKECAELGKELTLLGDRIIDSRVAAKVAIVFDWDNWWAVELSSGPSRDLDYVNEVWKYYHAFYEQNIQVDIIAVDDNFDSYQVIVAPVLYMTKSGFSDKVEAFTDDGGTFITTYFSGIVDEHDLVITGGYPGDLRNVLGIWVEEIDALPPGKTNHILMTASEQDEYAQSYSCSLLCDLLHLEGAEALAFYGEDFYKGMPAVTRNQYGRGNAYYIASSMDSDFLHDFTATVCRDQDIKPVLKSPKGVEVTRRVKEGKEIIFILNHNDYEEKIELDAAYVDLIHQREYSSSLPIAGKDVVILSKI